MNQITKINKVQMKKARVVEMLFFLSDIFLRKHLPVKQDPTKVFYLKHNLEDLCSFMRFSEYFSWILVKN